MQEGRGEQAITPGKRLPGCCNQRRGTTKEGEVAGEEKQWFCEQKEIKVLINSQMFYLHFPNDLISFTSFLAFLSIATD